MCKYFTKVEEPLYKSIREINVSSVFHTLAAVFNTHILSGASTGRLGELLDEDDPRALIEVDGIPQTVAPPNFNVNLGIFSDFSSDCNN